VIAEVDEFLDQKWHLIRLLGDRHQEKENLTKTDEFSFLTGSAGHSANFQKISRIILLQIFPRL